MLYQQNMTGSAQPEVRHQIRHTLTQICGMISGDRGATEGCGADLLVQFPRVPRIREVELLANRDDGKIRRRE